MHSLSEPIYILHFTYIIPGCTYQKYIGRGDTVLLCRLCRALSFKYGYCFVSRKHALLGTPGKDLEVDVPLGVCVRNEHGRVIGQCLYVLEFI